MSILKRLIDTERSTGPGKNDGIWLLSEIFKKYINFCGNVKESKFWFRRHLQIDKKSTMWNKIKEKNDSNFDLFQAAMRSWDFN